MRYSEVEQGKVRYGDLVRPDELGCGTVRYSWVL